MALRLHGLLAAARRWPAAADSVSCVIMLLASCLRRVGPGRVAPSYGLHCASLVRLMTTETRHSPTQPTPHLAPMLLQRARCRAAPVLKPTRHNNRRPQSLHCCAVAPAAAAAGWRAAPADRPCRGSTRPRRPHARGSTGAPAVSGACGAGLIPALQGAVICRSQRLHAGCGLPRAVIMSVPGASNTAPFAAPPPAVSSSSRSYHPAADGPTFQAKKDDTVNFILERLAALAGSPLLAGDDASEEEEAAAADGKQGAGGGEMEEEGGRPAAAGEVRALALQEVAHGILKGLAEE